MLIQWQNYKMIHLLLFSEVTKATCRSWYFLGMSLQEVLNHKVLLYPPLQRAWQHTDYYNRGRTV